MKNDLPPVVDMMSFIKALSQDPACEKLVTVATQAQRAQSCVADLTLAQTTCEAIGQLASCDFSAMMPLHQLTLQHSLVATALILYARATSTHSSGGERGSISIERRLDATDLGDHKMLVDLRNKVIAHVHSDESIGDSVWHRERMILKPEGPGWMPGCVTRRVQFDQATVSRLRQLIPKARELVRETYFKRLDYLINYLNANPGLATEMERHPFDAVDFFGSVQAAREALSPGLGQSAAGIVG